MCEKNKEDCFLYNNKKGLEFSVLRNNEFLEKIKIESEKLEEDYKTTINISEEDVEENEKILSKIKLIFFTESELEIEQIYNEFEEEYEKNSNKGFYEILYKYDEISFPKKFIEESENPLIDYSPKQCEDIEIQQKTIFKDYECFRKEIINPEKEIKTSVLKDKDYYKQTKEVFIKKDDYILYNYKSSDKQMADFEIEYFKGKSTFNGLKVKEMIETGKLGNNKKTDQLEKKFDLFIETLKEKLPYGKNSNKIFKSFQKEFENAISELSTKENNEKIKNKTR